MTSCGVLGAHQPLGEFERGGDVALGEAHGELAHLLGAAPPRLVSAVLTACWVAEQKLSKACLACSTLFSANARISAGISKFALPSLGHRNLLALLLPGPAVFNPI